MQAGHRGNGAGVWAGVCLGLVATARGARRSGSAAVPKFEATHEGRPPTSAYAPPPAAPKQPSEAAYTGSTYGYGRQRRQRRQRRSYGRNASHY